MSNYRLNPFRITCIVIFAVLACEFGGCAAAAAVGPDVAQAVVENGVGLLGKGKVETYQPVEIDETISTVRDVAQKLDLKYVKEEKHPDQIKLIYIDDRKQKVTITVVRRTETITELHVDVGLFGVEGMSRLVLRQILDRLPGGNAEDKKAMEPG